MPESNDVATYGDEQPGTALAIPPSSGSVIQSILASAKDPDVDAEKVKTLHDLAVGMIDRERAAEFNRAKIAAIRGMPAIYKRGQSDKHRYAKFEDLHRAAMPVLSANGLTLDFKVGNDGNMITVQPILRHENGWVEEGGVMKAPADTGPGRSPVQAIGSTTSYLKRHSFKAVMNIIEDGEDNDGVGFRPGEQKNDRQERLILDAEAKALEGDYDRWYRALNAKDRSYLVLVGIHARCGGAPALPRPTASEPEAEGEDAEFEPVVDEPETKAEEKPADPPPAAEEPEPDPTTPEGWTTIYERNCRNAENLDRLDAIAKAGANGLRKLAEGHEKLYERADAAMVEARERLGGGE